MARAVSTGAAPDRAAAWVEGFLSGGALLLLHDEPLLRLVDAWIAYPADSFTDVLPLLRRTFGAYPTAERRAIGDQLRRPASPQASPDHPEEDMDETRAAPAATTTLQILGWPTP